jgi:phage tail sheath protein FI
VALKSKMAEYLAPGVYIEETERGPRPIEGVPTSTTAFLGETLRGPVAPSRVTSFGDFVRMFGCTFADDKHLPDALSGFFANGGHEAYVCRIVGSDGSTATRAAGGLTIEAIGPGAWGNSVFVKLTDSTRQSADDDRPYGFRLQAALWTEPTPDDLYPDPFDPAQGPPQVAPIVEEFDNLVWDDPDSADFYLKRLEQNSALVTISPQSGPLEQQPAAPFAALTGGADGSWPSVENFRGDPSLQTGLAALQYDTYRDVALVAAPGATDDVVQALIEHCEQSRYRFAIVDAPPGQADAGALDPRAAWDSSYAAFYYPWIQVEDSRTGLPRLVPPSGYVAGIYARTDAERGVWKAPANETVNGAMGLEFDINDPTQDLLNPRGVNAIRQFPGRGIRVWGARTLSTNPLWKYVSVRRLFIFLERSIDQGTQWAVFEPNDEPLWERIKDDVRQFLRGLWRDGALMGATENQAFMIACDRSTMTQDDIVNGRLICEIGVAPLRPAEFIVFRIYQATADAHA